jgi:hypothetical protein
VAPIYLAVVELRRLPGWTLGIAAAIMAFPVTYGYLVREEYRLEDKLDLFTLMFENYVPLLFPILIAALYLPRLADEFSNGFVTAVRTRVHVGRYLISRMGSAAIVAFLTFFTTILIGWIVVAYIDPLLWSSTAYHPSGPGETPNPPESRFTYSQIYELSPLLMVVTWASWVGINAALYSILGVLVLMLVQNRFLALAIPSVIFLIGNLATALLGLEEFGPLNMVFPFSISQQPIWHSFVPFGVTVLACIALWLTARSRDFATAGLE